MHKKLIFLLLFFLTIGYTSFAQLDPLDPCNTRGICLDVCTQGRCTSQACLDCLESYAIPLDGGLLWLLLAGAGYGVKKILDHRKKQQVL
jgi:hypothetical protein